MENLNTTAYHPRVLQHLPLAKLHGSTNESPFYLFYVGRDARLSTEAVLSSVDLEDYKTELTRGRSMAWKSAQHAIAVAQKKQKKQFDHRAKDDS